MSVSRPAIVLVHDPACFADLAKGPHMMLAGHTHGGQICVPGIGPLINMSRAPLRHSFGLIEEDGRRMYVTSGIGTSGLPIRIGVPPEIVLLHVTGGP
jgi:predicted MPP superfamily phosphohydrolase